MVLTYIKMIQRVNFHVKIIFLQTNLQEIAKTIFIRFLTSDRNGTFSVYLNLTDSHNSVKEQRHRKFGRCYTVYPDEHMRDLGIYYIKLEL